MMEWKEWKNERKNERMNERKNERKDERKNKWKKKIAKKRIIHNDCLKQGNEERRKKRNLKA